MKVPYWGSLDNSLWTLRYEFECYLLVGVLGVIRCVHRHRFVIALSTLLLGVILALRSYAPTLQPDGILQMLFFADPQRARLWFMFALGAFLFLYAPAIPMRRSVTVAMLALLVLSVLFGQFAIIGRLAYAYLCIAAAVFLLVYRFDRFGDFSYGIYIYGFPVQQFLAVLRVYAWGFVPYLVLAFVGTLGLALLSWHFVEKPSLRCKSWRWLDGRLLPSRVRDLALTTRTLPAQQ